MSDTFDCASSLSEMFRSVLTSGALDTLGEDQVDAILDLLQRLPDDSSNDWEGMFAIGIKPFMDAYTYDQDRIDKCFVLHGRVKHIASLCYPL